MVKRVTNTVLAFRTKRGVTQEAFAEAVGVSRQTIIAIEKGVYTPSLLLAFSIARYFNTPIERIFSYE